LPPTLLLRDDHWAANAEFLCQPGTAIALGIGARRDAARADDDVRAAHGLRGEFLNAARIFGRVGWRASKKRGQKDSNGKNSAVFRHIHRPTINGYPFRRFRQHGLNAAAAEVVS
jgi:hypothetical protein